MSIFPFIDASGVTDTKKVTDLPLLKEYVRDTTTGSLVKVSSREASKPRDSRHVTK